MILEVVTDHQLWIWHAYIGVAASNNDINILNSSNLFIEQWNGNGLAIEFIVTGRQYHMGYYLVDAIYPRWPVFVKTVSCPMGDRRVLFAQKQEVARKDVERTFGVLQSRWVIVKGGRVTVRGDDEAGSSSSTATPPHVRGLPMGFNEVLSRRASMRNQQAHTQLTNDMIEEVWNRNGH
ncbi:uncharacterized protein LOC125209648 [Salvia hispanica]|uniref:uncharacterized protein LOC125209648 n=1 Tax=Salvia hispanica TaxID=49212 RepID=UPI0020097410|nr:uncharacterized protein LOC125209648 [Salvia hispanica]